MAVKHVNPWGGTFTDDDFSNDIWGSWYNDTIFAHGGNDDIDAGDGDDKVYGGDGDDTLRGGEGDDYLYDYSGADKFYGDGGIDTLSYAGFAGKVDVTLNGEAEGTARQWVKVALLPGGPKTWIESASDEIYGIENVTGGVGNDRIVGDSNDNRIDG